MSEIEPDGLEEELPEEMETSVEGRKDPLLVWEAVLGLVVLALFLVLFLIPAASEPFRPRWWAGPVLAAALFGLLGVDRWRRVRGRRGVLRRR